MKAKYKLGQLASTEVHTGEITGVITRTNEVAYELKGLNTAVGEDEVTKVFRPVLPRRPRDKATGKTVTAKKGKTEPRTVQ